jgi:formylglycine-generating enzyme required for sulfatase activity
MRIVWITTVFMILGSGCRSREGSSVKDVLYQGKAGAMLFYREGDSIKIKPCKEPVAIQNASQAGSACELKEGAVIQSVSVADFRRDMIDGLKLQISNPNTKAEVDKFGKEEIKKTVEQLASEQAAEREQLKQDIDRVKQMVESTQGGSGGLVAKVSRLESNQKEILELLSRMNVQLAAKQTPRAQDLDPVNAVVASLIDDMISKPGVIIINANSGADLFFGLLESYLTKEWVKEENTSSPDKLEFVEITAGKFMMGSPENEPSRDNDERQHEVTISKSFKMGKYEVTQGQWRAVMGDNPSYFKGSDDLPVEKVSWSDVQAFIRKLNDGTERCGDTTTAEGFKKAWSTLGCYRLPTEAEWEYAARAGTTTPFYTGHNITTDQANYNGNYPYNNNAKGVYRKKTVSVKELDAANPWGLMHMSGNVWEWNQDRYNENYDLSNTVDPMGATSGSDCVIRGGSWYINAQYVRSAYRYRGVVGSRNDLVGFRVVRTLP